MARPRIPAYSGSDADRRWKIIEEVRDSIKMSVGEMAGKIGLSENSWHHMRARRQMPVVAWERFEAIRNLLQDAESRLDDTVRAHQLLESAPEFGEGEIRAVVIIRDSFEGLISVNGAIDEPVYNGSLRKCAWPGCKRRFIPRSWNHAICSRDYHLQQEREQKRPRP